ncbi:MAG: cache domain-containing protein [Bacteroidales bacterium]
MTQQAIKTKRFNFTFLSFIFLFVISFAITSYFALRSHIKFKETLVKQWNQQLESTLEISAINLQNYFTKFSQNLNFLTHDTTVQKWAYTGVMSNCNRIDCPLSNLYNLHHKEADALLLLDTTGKIVVRYSSDDAQEVVMEKCCNNQIFINDTVSTKACISNVFINRSGKTAVTISYPLHYKNHFAGALRWMTTIENISGQFITPVKVGKDGYMFVMDRNKNIVAHPDRKLIGKSINLILDSISLHRNNSYNPAYLHESGNLFDSIEIKSEGSGKYIDFAYKEYCIAAFKKITIGDNEWTLIVSMPDHEISNPLRFNALTTYSLAGAIMLIICIIGIGLHRIQKKKTMLEVETKYLSEIAKTAGELKIERSKRLTAMIDGQENERQRFSREVHDGLGQYLLAMKVKLENEINSRKNENTESLNELRSLFVNTIEEVKRISDNLIPVILDEFGISTALKNLCNEISKNNTIKIEYVNYGIPVNIDSKIQTYIYRIAQEGLSNIIKHSKAEEANVQLLGNEEQVNLVIQDNGVGFQTEEANKGNGLNNMRERVAILNGIIDIQSKPNEGTTISVKIPLK